MKKRVFLVLAIFLLSTVVQSKTSEIDNVVIQDKEFFDVEEPTEPTEPTEIMEIIYDFGYFSICEDTMEQILYGVSFGIMVGIGLGLYKTCTWGFNKIHRLLWEAQRQRDKVNEEYKRIKKEENKKWKEELDSRTKNSDKRHEILKKEDMQEAHSREKKIDEIVDKIFSMSLDDLKQLENEDKIAYCAAQKVFGKEETIDLDRFQGKDKKIFCFLNENIDKKYGMEAQDSLIQESRYSILDVLSSRNRVKKNVSKLQTLEKTHHTAEEALLKKITDYLDLCRIDGIKNFSEKESERFQKILKFQDVFRKTDAEFVEECNKFFRDFEMYKKNFDNMVKKTMSVKANMTDKLGKILKAKSLFASYEAGKKQNMRGLTENIIERREDEEVKEEIGGGSIQAARSINQDLFDTSLAEKTE